MNKRMLLGLYFVLTALVLQAQSPSAFTYQAVARDASGNAAANKSVSLRLSVLNNGTAEYVETFATQTNAYGMFSVNIGMGTRVSGTFSGIDWSQGTAKSLKTEMDLAGGTAYADMGITAFASVPYALVANSVSNVSLDDLLDVSNTTPSQDQVLRWTGTEWAPATLASGTLVTSTDFSGNGTSGSPLKLASQNAISGQVLQWSGTAWTPATLTGSGVGDNWGTQFVQKNVTLDGNGTNASPLTIAQQGAANGETLIWNGTLWSPGRPAISVDGVFTGQGTPTLPLKLGQQGAATGDVLKWNGTSWVPGSGFTLPFNSTVSSNNSTSFVVTNNGTGAGAIAGQVLNGGTGIAVAGSHNAGGIGVQGSTDFGIGVRGMAGSSGLAGKFEGNTAVVNGNLTVSGFRVMRSDEFYTADQSSALNVQNTTATDLPGLNAINFTVDNTASASAPARVIVTFSTPSVGTTSNATAGEDYQFQLFIKQSATIVKQVNCNAHLPSLGVLAFSYALHQQITTPGTYTVSVKLFKSDGSAAKNISVDAGQVQIQVIHQ